MRSIDFEYDGRCLSDYGFIICSFDGPPGTQRVESGSVITFNQVPTINGAKHRLTSTRYESCYQATFDICKDPDKFEPDHMEVTDEEYRMVLRWLNRREFLKARFYFEDETVEPCYYNASFNANRITVDEILYGLELTMFTDAPFGCGTERTYDFSFTNGHLTNVITDMSDEIGHIYPKVVITCKADGPIALSNSDMGTVTIVEGCTTDEVITIDGNTQTISTSLQSHDIFNDFNYEFLKIGNTFDNRKNTITATAPCEVVITYSPINKGTP